MIETRVRAAAIDLAVHRSHEQPDDEVLGFSAKAPLEAPGRPNCPRCRRADRLHAIADLVDPTTGHPRSGEISSETAAMLLPPGKDYPQLDLIVAGVVSFVAIVGVLIAAAVQASGPRAAILGLLGVVFAVVGSRILRSHIERYRRGKRAWMRALGRWRLLYYCGRCDGVFLPNESYLVTPSDIDHLLFERDRRRRQR